MDWMGTEEVCEYLGIRMSTLRSWYLESSLKYKKDFPRHRKFGKKVKFDSEEIERWARNSDPKALALEKLSAPQITPALLHSQLQSFIPEQAQVKLPPSKNSRGDAPLETLEGSAAYSGPSGDRIRTSALSVRPLQALLGNTAALSESISSVQETPLPPSQSNPAGDLRSTDGAPSSSEVNAAILNQSLVDIRATLAANAMKAMVELGTSTSGDVESDYYEERIIKARDLNWGGEALNLFTVKLRDFLISIASAGRTVGQIGLPIHELEELLRPNASMRASLDSVDRFAFATYGVFVTAVLYEDANPEEAARLFKLAELVGFDSADFHLGFVDSLRLEAFMIFQPNCDKSASPLVVWDRLGGHTVIKRWIPPEDQQDSWKLGEQTGERWT